MTKISQAARDAAMKFHGYGSWDDVVYWASGHDRDSIDDTAEAFARFEAEIVERCAKVAEQEPPFKHGPAVATDAYRRDIATAIRSQL